MLNLRYWLFQESLGAGDDHTAHGMAALDMAIVIDFDALRGGVHGKSLGQPFEQLALTGGFSLLARQTFAGVAQCAVDQFCLFASRWGTMISTLRPSLPVRASVIRSAFSIGCDNSSMRGGSLLS